MAPVLDILPALMAPVLDILPALMAPVLDILAALMGPLNTLVPVPDVYVFPVTSKSPKLVIVGIFKYYRH
jgi:hypothetical protein